MVAAGNSRMTVSQRADRMMIDLGHGATRTDMTPIRRPIPDPTVPEQNHL